MGSSFLNPTFESNGAPPSAVEGPRSSLADAMHDLNNAEVRKDREKDGVDSEIQEVSLQCHCCTMHVKPGLLISQALYPESDRLSFKLKLQFWVLNFLVLAHILVIAYTDPLKGGSVMIQALVSA